MKTKFRNKLKQKIIIPIIIVLTFNFIVPNYSQASLGGILVTPVVSLLAVLGDAINRLIFLTVGEEFGVVKEQKTDTTHSIAEQVNLGKKPSDWSQMSLIDQGKFWYDQFCKANNYPMQQYKGWKNIKLYETMWGLKEQIESTLRPYYNENYDWDDNTWIKFKSEAEEADRKQEESEQINKELKFPDGRTYGEVIEQGKQILADFAYGEYYNRDESFIPLYKKYESFEEVSNEDVWNDFDLYYEKIKGDQENFLEEKIWRNWGEAEWQQFYDDLNTAINSNKTASIDTTIPLTTIENLTAPIRRGANEGTNKSIVGTGIKAILGIGEYKIYLTNDAEKENYCEENPPEVGLINKALSMKGDETKGVDDEIQGGYGIPNIAITPAEIFSNKIAMLNANYFKTDAEISEQIGGQPRSVVYQLKTLISKWYNTLRLIAIFGLLSVLVYIGIRIMLSSSAGDKAKYKERLQDWLVAMCLIFFLHYIMVFTMTVVDEITEVIANTGETGTSKQVNIFITEDAETKVNIDGTILKSYNNGNISIQKDDGSMPHVDTSKVDSMFSSSLIGYMRLTAEHTQAIQKLSGVIMYLALTFYTAYFIFIYLKRLLTLTFLTVTAPLVALTYPLDKLRDGKAQAFNYWIREYMINALLPIIHLLLYTILVSNAMELAATAPLYAIVALAFIVPAEKIVKEMFGFKANLAPAGGAAGIAGGYLAIQGMNMLARRGMGGKGPKGEGSGAGNGGGSNPRIRTGNQNAGQVDSNFSDLALGSGAGNGGNNNRPPSGNSTNRRNNNQRLLEGSSGGNDNPPPPPPPGGSLSDISEDRIAQENEEPSRQQENAQRERNLEDNTRDIMAAGGLMSVAKHDDDREYLRQEMTSLIEERRQMQGNFPNSTEMTRPETVKDILKSRFAGVGEVRRSLNAFADDTGKGKLANNAAHLIRKRYRNAGGAKGIASKTGRKLGRAAVRGTIGVAGASIGLAGGMVGGNLSDMWKGLTLGAVAGGTIGKNVANKIERKAASSANTRRELLYGEQAAEAEARRKEFASNEDNISFIRDKYKDKANGPKTTREIKEHLRNMSVYEKAAGGDLKNMDKLYNMEKEITGGVKTSGKEFKELPVAEQQRRLTEKDRAQKYVSQIAELSSNYNAQDFRGTKYEASVNDLTNRLSKEARLESAQARTQAEKILKDIRKYKKY